MWQFAEPTRRRHYQRERIQEGREVRLPWQHWLHECTTMSKLASEKAIFFSHAAIFLMKSWISPLISSEAFIERNPVKPLQLAHWDNWPWVVFCVGVINHLLFVVIVSTWGIVPVRWKTRHVYKTSVVFQIGLFVCSSTALFKALVEMHGKQAISNGV